MLASNICEKAENMLNYIYVYYVYTDQSTNACKISTKTNSCETLSDSIEIDEWLPVDDNDQDDVLHVRDVSIKIYYNVYYIHICCSNVLNTN